MAVRSNTVTVLYNNRHEDIDVTFVQKCLFKNNGRRI